MNKNWRKAIYFTEGEKDADRLRGEGLIAVCVRGGASGKLPPSCLKYFKDRDVVMVADNDLPGRKYAHRIAAAMKAIPRSIRIVEFRDLPEHGDVSDYFDLGHTVNEFLQLVQAAAEWDPDGEHDEDTHLETKPRGISNAIIGESGKPRGQQLETIAAAIFKQTDNWPRRVGAMLFVHHPLRGIIVLRNTAGVFAWLHTAVGNVLWFSCASCVTKEELVQGLTHLAIAYESIQELPHEPLIPAYYYALPTVPPADGQFLEGLIDCFEPETPLDRSLIIAAFLTPLWGGSAGARPIFVITAAGRGHGKTTLVSLISLLFGGCLTFSKGEDIGTIIQRLLSPEGLKSRIVLLDNLKTSKFSWAEFEALVTALVISGKQMYVGEASRPNHLTYFLTGNALALSTDIAQRSVIVRLGKPTHSGDWFAGIRDFIVEHRLELIADMIAILRRKGVSLPVHTRWGEWEDGVLAKLPNAVEAQQLIIRRRGESDVEAATAATVEAFIEKRLNAAGYDTERQRIRIPTEIVVNWFNAATEQNATVSQASAILRQMAEEGQLKRLRKNPSHKQSRSFIWTGPAFEGESTVDFERRPKKS